MFKKVILLLVVVILLVSMGLFGCKTVAAEEEVTEINIAFSVPLSADVYYQNLVESMRNTIPGIEEKTGLTINLDVAEADNDITRQTADVETFISKGYDVLFIGTIDPEVSRQLIDEAHDAGMPVVTTAIMSGNEDVYMTRDNFQAGIQAGKAVGEYILENFNSQDIVGKVLVVHFPAIPAVIERVDGFFAGLDETGCEYEKTAEVDGQGSLQTSLELCTDALTAHPDVNVIYGINNESTAGAIEAIKGHNLSLDDFLLSSIGIYRDDTREMLLERDNYIGVACFSDFCGYLDIHYCVAVALGLVEKNEDGTPHIGAFANLAVNKDNFLDLYYKEGDVYKENFDAVAELLKETGGIEPYVINLK